MMEVRKTISNLPSWNPAALLRMTGLISKHSFKLADTPDLSGKVAVVTGGQAGIGKEIAAQLLLHGISMVYIIARTESRYNDAKLEWVEKGIAAEEIDRRTEFVQCDLSDIQDVKRAADHLRSRLERLDILINNAGHPPMPEYKLSAQGIEMIFATNHVGHFLLTNLLLPLLESTAKEHGSSRVVVTTSSLHLVCQELDVDKLTSPVPTKHPSSLDSLWRYGRSKLANVLFTQELASILRNKGVTNIYANCFFPGNIPTDAMDTWKLLFGSLVGKAFKGTFGLIGQSAEDAAATAMFLAAGKDVEVKNLNGVYFVPIATEEKPSKTAQSEDLAASLWSWTDHKIGETLGTDWQRTVDG